jgi:methyl-accepting chemotaxis protein
MPNPLPCQDSGITICKNSATAGRGLSVVAREVRELSLQTEAANEKIADKISGIQRASKAIIEYTQQTEKRIERLMLASHQISAAVEQQNTVTTDISKSVHATTNHIKDVSSRISNVDDAAKGTSRFAGSVASHSEQIEGQLSALLHETREKLSKAGLTGTVDRCSNELAGKKKPLPVSVKPHRNRTKKKQSAA